MNLVGDPVNITHFNFRSHIVEAPCEGQGGSVQFLGSNASHDGILYEMMRRSIPQFISISEIFISLTADRFGFNTLSNIFWKYGNGHGTSGIK